LTLKKASGPGFTATTRLTSIVLDGIAVRFRNAGLYVDEASPLKRWHVDLTDVPPSLSAGLPYQAVLVDDDGTEYRGKVIPSEVPKDKPDAVRLLGSGPLEGWRSDA